MRTQGLLFGAAAIFLSGCAAVPHLPPNTDAYVREVLMNASCEMQDALRELDTRRYARFKARQWLVDITLQPRVDTIANAGFGFSGRDGNSSYIFGAGAGAGVDIKANRNSAATFNMKSRELILTKKLHCDRTAPTFHALSQNLKVGQWLLDTAGALEVNPIAEIDKPRYNSQLTIRFAADGSYSYVFSAGTPTIGAGGSYSTDQQLLIQLIPVEPPPAPFVIRTLPVNGLESTDVRNVATFSATQQARQRGDTIAIDTALQNLKQAR